MRFTNISLPKGLGAVVCLALASASFPAQAQNIVNNPGFESGLTGWATNPNNSWFATSTAPISGTQSASTGCVGDACIRNSAGGYNTTGGSYLYQDLVTTPGAFYNLSFDFHSAGNPNELAVLFGNTTAFDQVDMSTATATYSVFNLLASDPVTRLLFLGRQDPAFNRLDNVSVVATGQTGSVPEPATWGMMLLGFAGIGLAVRYRRSTGRSARLA